MYNETMVPDLDALVDAVMSGATHAGSLIHGPSHWLIVSRNGIDLAGLTPGADPLVAYLFGLIHDAKRFDDGRDSEHGPRAAVFAQELHAEGLFRLEKERLDLLVTACDTHTTARTTLDPTLGVCYDADRLDLWRIGIEPHPNFLSTEAAKDKKRISAGMWREDPLDWRTLFGRLRA